MVWVTTDVEIKTKRMKKFVVFLLLLFPFMGTAKTNYNKSGITDLFKDSTSIVSPDPAEFEKVRTQGPILQAPSGQSGSGLGNVIPSKNTYDITDYGAIGNGIVDDRQAIQLAINACRATDGDLIIPRPSNFYRINGTLEIMPKAPDDQIYIKILGQGQSDLGIVYMGPSGQPAIKLIGLKGGSIDNVNVRIGEGISNAVCWDIGTDELCSSTAGFTFSNCVAALGTGVNNRGWRLGFIDGKNVSDISQILWSNCTAWGNRASGSIGWENVGHNTYQLTWVGGGGAFLDTGVSATLGSSQFFFGIGFSQNNTDFHFGTSGQFSIYGSRFESGKQFLVVDCGSMPAGINITGTSIDDYHPENGRLIDFKGSGTLLMDNVKIARGVTDFGKNMIYLEGPHGSFIARGGTYSASDPFVTNSTGWRVSIENVIRMKSTNYLSAGFFTNR